MNKKLLLLFMICFSSCATIVGGSKYTFTINSTPSEAKISVTNKKGAEVFTGNTPAVVRLKSGNGYFSRGRYTVRFSKPGYTEKVAAIDFRLNGWYFGNILIGGVIGLVAVDPLTGGMWMVNRNDQLIYQKLDPNAAAATAPSLKVIDFNTLSEQEKSALVKIQ